MSGRFRLGLEMPHYTMVVSRTKRRSPPVNSYQIPEDRRCQICNARMAEASWRCPSCGASQTPPLRPGASRDSWERSALRPFVIFAVALIVVVVAMFAAGWGQYFVRGPYWGPR